jgi:tetratricopeptide (TPR) repeat protein
MKKVLIIPMLLGLALPVCAAEDYLAQGAGHLSAGRYGAAIRAYQAALKTTPDSAEAYSGIGRSYYQMGNQEIAYDVEKISAAVSAFNQSLALKNDPEVCYLLGLSYLALYDKKNAEKAYASLKSSGSQLAEKLALQIAAYVKPAKFETGHPTPPRNDQTTVVIRGNQVCVPVTVSYRGRSARALLLLDTGASVTGISDGIAAQLGLETSDTNPMLAVVADGRAVRARWFEADSLAVGPKVLAPLRIGILPGSLPGVDGLLGMDFLRSVRYQVNFSRSVIEWNSR